MQTQFESASAAGSEVLADAKSLSATAVNRVHNEFDDRKGEAAAQVKSVSSAIGSAAEQLDPAAPVWLKSALEQGAAKIQEFAATLEQKDSRQLANTVGDFARRSPATFLAACAVAGFGAARVLKSSSSAGDQAYDTAPTQTDVAEYQSAYQPQAGQHADGLPGGTSL